ncbi:MAG: hypothetical protein Q4C86_01675 [bacterium]|nr:hypothetical protein [bacterium]
MKSLKRVLMAFFIILVTGCAALAGPALRNGFTLAQPDGESFFAVKRGDEFLHWYETAEGYAVVKDDATGYWVFALASAAGGLTPSTVVYAPGAAAPSGCVKNFIPAKNTVASLRKKYSGPASSKTSAAAARTWTSNPIAGEREALFIRINFQDAAFKSTFEDTKDQIWGDTHSVRSYYLDQSHGALSIVSADFGGDGKRDLIEITMTSADYNEGRHPDRLLSSSNYDGDYTISHKNEVAFVTSVLKRTGLDFGQFDKNGDGVIEADELVVYMLLAGYEESASDKSPSVWMHAWSSWSGEGREHNVYVSDAIILGHWSYGGELSEKIGGPEDVSLPLIGGIVHELGHQICKLPDLYDVRYTNNGLGLFSVMASGSWGRRSGEYPGMTPPNLDAWSRKYLGWDVPKTLTPGGTPVSFTCGTPGNGTFPSVRINSPYVDSTYEYILAEVRNPNAGDWDGGIGGSLGDEDPLPASFRGGVLLQHIDERVGSGSLGYGNDFNAYTEEGHQGNMAIWADGDSRAKDAGQGGWRSLWYAGSDGSPDTYFYGARDTNIAEQFSGIRFSAFPPSGETISAVVAKQGRGGGSGCSAAAYPLLLLLGAASLVLGRKR